MTLKVGAPSTAGNDCKYRPCDYDSYEDFKNGNTANSIGGRAKSKILKFCRKKQSLLKIVSIIFVIGK